ncbi:MAG: RNA polymerase sigma factor [Planctomycetota bacterium]|jgi:RNA polymerase sigma-70 factor (ECF subfamily)
MGETDAELAAQTAKGDMAALEALYRRHVDRVWRYAWFRTHSREAAAEIVQETFLRVARAVPRFQGRSTFATWLFAVTRSVAIDHARRSGRSRRPARPADLFRLVRPNDDPPDALGDRETRDAVRRAVANLPSPQRDATVLCELSGLSIRQAAEVLGWGESRVKVTLFRARRRLRDALREYATGDVVHQSGEA